MPLASVVSLSGPLGIAGLRPTGGVNVTLTLSRTVPDWLWLLPMSVTVASTAAVVCEDCFFGAT